MKINNTEQKIRKVEVDFERVESIKKIKGVLK